MKNLMLGFFLFGFLLFTETLTAQHKLTNREIYNFEVGDVLHTSYYKRFSPIEYVKRKIDTKWYSMDLDTVFYEITDSIYRYSPPNAWELSVENHFLSYHDLDSFPKPKHPNPDFDDVIPQYSSTFKSGLIENTYYFDIVYNNLQQYYIESVGLFYKHTEYIGDLEEELVLLYFKRGDSLIIGEPMEDLSKVRQLQTQEIFNFEVGDVFHYRFDPLNNPPSYLKRRVIEKLASTSPDSFSYKYLDSTYNLVITWDPAPYYELFVREHIVSYLKNQAPIDISKIARFTSEFNTSLNVNMNTYYFHEAESSETHYFYEGLGEVYHWWKYKIGGSNKVLVYYKKGAIENGDKITISVANVSPIYLKIYPNPTQSELFVEGITVGSSYKITSVTGAEVLNGNFDGNPISVLGLSQGFYIIQFLNEGQVYQTRFIKE